MRNGGAVVPSAKCHSRESSVTPGDVCIPPLVSVLPGPKIIVRSATMGWVAVTRIPNDRFGNRSPITTTVRCCGASEIGSLSNGG
jgi:hypothetical protein